MPKGNHTLFFMLGVVEMEGMQFDAGTWWLAGLLLTALIGVAGALLSRSIFKRMDENSADIKEVRENYTTRKDHQNDLTALRNAHQKDMESLRKEVREVRNEMRTEIKQMSDDIKDIKENCIRREEFVSHQLKLENKLDRLMEFIMKGAN